MATIIKEFNLLYKHLNTGRNTYTTLLGQPAADPTTSTTLAPSQSPKAKYFTYGLPHKLKNCKQLFQSLRGPNFVPNDECLRRCQEWLKVPTNKQYYDKRLKQIEQEGPKSRTSPTASSTAEKSEDLDRPPATAAAVKTSFSSSASSTLSQDHPDLSLINAWGYDTMADTHFCNNIRYFRDFKPSMSTATAGDSGVEIHGYGDINLAIEVGEQRLTRYLTLRNVAYAPYFHTNLISAAKLRRVGVIMDQSTNHLRYKDDGSLFANLTEYGGLYLVDATACLPPTPTAYATSTRFFKTSAYDKVWHQRLLHCDMESVDHLPTAADGVKVVKTDRGRTLYGVPLCELCVLGKMAQQIFRRKDGSKDWMENFDEELDVGLPHLANIDVTPTLKSIQISTEEPR